MKSGSPTSNLTTQRAYAPAVGFPVRWFLVDSEANIRMAHVDVDYTWLDPGDFIDALRLKATQERGRTEVVPSGARPTD